MVDTEERGLGILDKANAILSVLESGRELTAGEIAQSTGAPASSTYRLLRSLTALNLVDPGSKTGLYRIGVYFLFVGGLVEQRLDLREAARGVLQDLLADTGWSCTLYVPRGSRAICLERFEPTSIRTTTVRVGDALPLHLGAGPRASLAFLPEAQQRAVLDQVYVSGQPASQGLRRPRHMIESQLQQDRQRGYAISDEEVDRGIAAVGAPIFDHRGAVLGAVAVGYMREALLAPESRAIEVTLNAAAEISRAMGCPPGKRR